MPSLRSATHVKSRSFHVRDRDHHHDGHRRHHHGRFHGFFSPFAFHFGFAFGYPYFNYDPYYWQPHFAVHVGYPYVGYYYSYPYSYFAWNPYYDCDFYDGYNVRFGYYRASYHVACSGWGQHAYRHHHSHYYECPNHGYHYYHVRDCSLCYASGGSYVVHDVEVPDVPIEAVSQPAEASPGVTDALPETVLPETAATSDVSRITPAESASPIDREEAFYASLKPAQLSFVLGLINLRSGDYSEAVEALYNASLEDPDSKLVKVFLGAALFSVGEYRYASEYLRLGLADWPAFPTYQWDIARLYGNRDDFAAHLSLLEEEVRLNPADADARLVLAIVRSHSASAPARREDLEDLRSLAEDPVDLEIAARYVSVAESRSGIKPAADRSPETGEDSPEAQAGEEAVRTFLASLSLKDVPALSIR